MICCDVCIIKYPNTVKLHMRNQRLPPVATANGTAYRSDVIENHLKSDYHMSCVKADRIKSLSAPDKHLTPLDISIDRANSKQANYIAKLMIQIYADAKILTVAAWNWPARYVTNEASNHFEFENPKQSVIPKNLSLHYINPVKHLEIMECIVTTDIKFLQNTLADCLAISLRVDGSIDRQQKDKIYVLGKVVTKDGNAVLMFLGMDEQTERGAVGLFRTALNAMEKMFSKEFVYQCIMPKMSSICTDGTNVNTGERGGLWTYFENAIAQANSRIPLMKIWCVAHRSNKTFEDISKHDNTIAELISKLSSIASYFHQSSVRTVRLKEIAAENKVNYLTMPKEFEIRWTEYTFNLFKAILTNWNALVFYFGESQDATAKGFLVFLASPYKLKALTFCADVLYIFKRFQKQLQSDSLILPNFCEIVRKTIVIYNDLIDNPLIGGFEQKLSNQLEERDDGKLYLKGIELEEERVGRRQPLEISELRRNVIRALMGRLKVRLQDENEELLSVIEGFLTFDKNSDITKVHDLIAKDLDLSALNLQYIDLSNSQDDVKKQVPQQLLRFLRTENRIEHFHEISIVIARIIACTPHSADCERTISANNNLKTLKRMNLSITTENYYLYCHFNMPPLERWDPRPAVRKWMIDVGRRQSTVSISSNSTTKKSYFKHIFATTEKADKESTNKENFTQFEF